MAVDSHPHYPLDTALEDQAPETQPTIDRSLLLRRSLRRWRNRFFQGKMAFVWLGLGALCFLTAFYVIKTRLDDRSRASLADGIVEITIRPESALQIHEPSVFGVYINTKQLAIDGFEIVGTVEAPENALIAVSVESAAPSGMSIIRSEYKEGKLYLSGLTANPQQPFRNEEFVKLATLTFTTEQTGSVTFRFTDQDSLVSQHGEAKDVLKSIQPHVFQIEAPTCTEFTYGEWGPCEAGVQLRDILASVPGECVGGNPVLEQSCEVESSPDVTPTPSPSPSPSPTPTPTPTPKASPTPTPKASPTPTPEVYTSPTPISQVDENPSGSPVPTPGNTGNLPSSPTPNNVAYPPPSAEPGFGDVIARSPVPSQEPYRPSLPKRSPPASPGESERPSIWNRIFERIITRWSLIRSELRELIFRR